MAWSLSNQIGRTGKRCGDQFATSLLVENQHFVFVDPGWVEFQRERRFRPDSICSFNIESAYIDFEVFTQMNAGLGGVLFRQRFAQIELVDGCKIQKQLRTTVLQ